MLKPSKSLKVETKKDKSIIVHSQPPNYPIEDNPGVSGSPLLSGINEEESLDTMHMDLTEAVTGSVVIEESKETINKSN
jgi:hypothetical protein